MDFNKLEMNEQLCDVFLRLAQDMAGHFLSTSCCGAISDDFKWILFYHGYKLLIENKVIL